MPDKNVESPLASEKSVDLRFHLGILLERVVSSTMIGMIRE